MHHYLERVVAISKALRRTVFSLGDFEVVMLLWVVVVAFLAFTALSIGWLRNRRKKKRRLLLERELHRVQEFDDQGNQTIMTVIDAFRLRFPGNIPPEKRTTGEDQRNAAVEETERKVGGERRG